jgi:hypothetical protein
VPTELVEPARERRTRLAQRQRRHHRFMRRIGRIARQTRHAHHPVVLGVERLQRLVVDRPVIGDAVQRAHAEVRWVEPREVTRIQYCAAADTVEVRDLDRRVGVVDRIVGVPGPSVRANVEIVELPGLPVAACAWVLGGLHPVALLKAENVHLRLGEAPRHSRAGGTGANNQNINGVGHRKKSALYARRRVDGGWPRLSMATCYPRSG